MPEPTSPSPTQFRRPRWWLAYALLALTLGVWQVFFRAPDVNLAGALAGAERYLDLAEYAKAEVTYDKILQLVPGHLRAKQGYQKARLFQESAAHAANSAYAAGQIQQRLTSLLADLPDDPHVLTVLGDLYRHGAELDKARRYYRGALAQRDSVTAAHFGLGSVLLAQQHYAKAYPHLQRAVADAPHQPSYLRALGRLYLLQGDYPRAQQQLRQALQEDGDFLLLYQELALAHWWHGEIAAARDILSTLAARLDDAVLLRQAKNQAYWRFPSPRSGLAPGLDSWADKRAYIYASLAAGFFLLDDADNAQHYAAKAQAENSPVWQLIHLLVARDVELALHAKPELATAVQRWQDFLAH